MQRNITNAVLWSLIFGVWGFITYLLWQVWWLWAIIWVVPGFVISFAATMAVLIPAKLLLSYFLLRRLLKQVNDYQRDEPPDSN